MEYFSHMQQWMFLGSVTFAISMVVPLAAGDLSTQIVRTSEKKTLDAAPSGTLHLENARGAVNIEGWDQATVEITVIKSTTGLFRASDAAQRDAATHLQEHAQVTSERKGDEILISTQVPRRDRGALEVMYYIRAPRDSKIVINGNGGVYVIGMTGDIQANMQHGEITLTLPENAEYGVDARATFGEVYWGVDGQGERHHLLGHSFVGATVSSNPSAATQGPAQARPGQTVPITVTTSEGGTEQAQRMNAPVVADPTKPQSNRHKLKLNVCFGDIVITKAYMKHAS